MTKQDAETHKYKPTISHLFHGSPLGNNSMPDIGADTDRHVRLLKPLTRVYCQIPWTRKLSSHSPWSIQASSCACPSLTNSLGSPSPKATQPKNGTPTATPLVSLLQGPKATMQSGVPLLQLHVARRGVLGGQPPRAQQEAKPGRCPFRAAEPPGESGGPPRGKDR